MKAKLVLFILFLGLNSYLANCQVINACDPNLIDELESFQLKDGIFTKSFSISLPRYSKANPHPSDSISIDLAGKSTYWILLESSYKKMGKAKLCIYDSTNTMVQSLENKSSMVLAISQIKTEKPANYHFKIGFDKGFEGCAGIAIYYVPNYKLKRKDK